MTRTFKVRESVRRCHAIAAEPKLFDSVRKGKSNSDESHGIHREHKSKKYWTSERGNEITFTPGVEKKVKVSKLRAFY